MIFIWRLFPLAFICDVYILQLTPSLKDKGGERAQNIRRTFQVRLLCLVFGIFALSLRNILVGVSVVGGTIQYCIKEKVLH